MIVRDATTNTHNGGIVVKQTRGELVARNGGLALYASNSDNPMDLSGATAKLTALPGTKTQGATLASAETMLGVKDASNVPPCTKAKASINLKTESASTARFSLS